MNILLQDAMLTPPKITISSACDPAVYEPTVTPTVTVTPIIHATRIKVEPASHHQVDIGLFTPQYAHKRFSSSSSSGHSQGNAQLQVKKRKKEKKKKKNEK